MRYIICRFCKVRYIQAHTNSGKYGGCNICRAKLIPEYIPEKQHKLFLDLLNRKINDRQHKLHLKEK